LVSSAQAAVGALAAPNAPALLDQAMLQSLMESASLAHSQEPLQQAALATDVLGALILAGLPWAMQVSAEVAGRKHIASLGFRSACLAGP